MEVVKYEKCDGYHQHGGGKLRAVKRYMVKKEADLEQELGKQLQRLYEKYVPANVREYIDESCEESLTALPVQKKQKEKSREQPHESANEII